MSGAPYRRIPKKARGLPYFHELRIDDETVRREEAFARARASAEALVKRGSWLPAYDVHKYVGPDHLIRENVRVGAQRVWVALPIAMTPELQATADWRRRT